VVRGYYAYFGRYQVPVAGDSITHLVETSLRPNEVGVTYHRAIRLARDRLFIILSTLRRTWAGAARTSRSSWSHALQGIQRRSSLEGLSIGPRTRTRRAMAITLVCEFLLARWMTLVCLCLTVITARLGR
jgi:hypothetical protein